MPYNFIYIKFKDKNFTNLNNNNKIIELFRLSIGNCLNNLKYLYKSNRYSFDKKFIYKIKTISSQRFNNNNKQFLVQYLEIINKNKSIKENIAKMIYKITDNMAENKIINKIFILNNKKRTKLIIKNKQYFLEENNNNEINKIYKIKIKFFDNIINISFMFKDCKSLSSVYNLENLNTKYLKSLKNIFEGCSSLLFINDISNWNIININYL